MNDDMIKSFVPLLTGREVKSSELAEVDRNE